MRQSQRKSNCPVAFDFLIYQKLSNLRAVIQNYDYVVFSNGNCKPLCTLVYATYNRDMNQIAKLNAVFLLVQNEFFV